MISGGLRALCAEHGLCPPLLGLDKHTPGRCFNHQLKRCQGACLGLEPADQHVARAEKALAGLKVESWPYQGAIGIEEGGVLHVVENWCYFGSVAKAHDAGALIANSRPAFDLDVYKLLVRMIGASPAVHLSNTEHPLCPASEAKLR